ncbi:uncharacterized protein LOC109520125 [Hippocampus comes]|uniref:Si:dkeyp-38g8.5 n=1 Tax=Hippocampus comes TaxID=109280 RepID=A0A3Q3DE77_HIPCM|nr:PREDICTED: uncharacterized protein LOC109520125 [Hippocampus comes]XP_019732660.1 PREDICTED: uncharacterized protein LOC109520125 [Hippocampus comes]
MAFQDHAYTSTTYDTVNPVEPIYNWSLKEAEELVKLRMSNNYLFSGKRNTSAWAWMAILRHMGLQYKLNHRQAKKKWQNLRQRYKELKDKSHCYMWPLFTLMDDAMEGRLEGSAPVLGICAEDKLCISPRGKKRKRTPVSISPAQVTNIVPEIEVTLNGDSGTGEEEDGADEDGMEDSQEFMSQDEATEREKRFMELERMALQRDRALLEREIAIVDRDRALMERERLLIEREKEMVAKDRDAINRERQALERQKAVSEPPTSRKTTRDNDSIDRTERFLDLFEKLIDSF